MKFKLLEGIGIEAEYMIVDKKTLKVNPIADLLLFDLSKKHASNFEFEKTGISNELVKHVIEIKNVNPKSTFLELHSEFFNTIKILNDKLKKYDSILLSTAMHPFMNPDTETKLWQDENKEIYETYDKIFNCKGHGWSNLQSVHLNLSFGNDEEFGKLHSAIRLVLPIIPALSASSPIFNLEKGKYHDSRMFFYKYNSSKIPSITGKVIPEAIFSIKDYKENVFKKMYKDISPYDPNKILQDEWLNARGAIARFDRNAIEIRIVDIQECILSDFAIANFIYIIIKNIINEKFSNYESQKKVDTDSLAKLFDEVIEKGENSIIYDETYLKSFNISKKNIKIIDLWKYLYDLFEKDIPLEFRNSLRIIIEKGNLSTRILKEINGDYSKNNIIKTYKKFSECLEKNEMFIPKI